MSATDGHDSRASGGDADLNPLRERFQASPGDEAAFQALEERFFLRGDWNDLVRLYERRLEAPELEADPRRRGELLMRLGQVLEERCLEIDRAIECYQDLARSLPDFRPPLVQLRRIYVTRGQWELALQVAEVEGSLPMAPHQKAAFAVEMGEIWLHHLDEPEQARVHFERALETDPNHVAGLLGMGGVLEELDRPDEAVGFLERAVERLAGPDRAPALVALASLHARRPGGGERAEELYRRALTDDPRNEEALEALVQAAGAKEQWELVAELQERRFNLAAGAMRRLALAHEAGRLWLEQLRNPQGARLWLRRALELFPEDPMTQFLLADTERLAGNREALTQHLGRGIELAGEAAPNEALREYASLAKECGDLAAAAAPLKILLQRFPERRELASELADVLERVGRDDELVEILERQVALSQGEPRAHAAALVQLGNAQEERGDDPDGAIASYERALGVDPASAEAANALEQLYRKTEDWSKLRAHLDATRARATGARAVELHCAWAELLLDRFADPDGAREAFETALRIDPDAERAQAGLDRIAVATGDEETLLESYEREASVTTERGRLAFLVWEMVRIREQRAEREEALLWLERLVGADPENFDALEHCARLQEQLGHDEALIETLERLDVLLEGEAQAANRRRIAGLRRAHGETDRAIDGYRRALDADPTDAEALALLSELYERAGRWAELVEIEGERALQLPDAERAEALARVATLRLERLDDLEGALLVLGGLVDEGIASEADAQRLERLLEDAERHDELEERLAARRPRAEGDEARAIDLRRARLLLDHLARPGEAAALLKALRAEDPEDPELRDLLERALREANDVPSLAALLGERAEESGDPDRAAALSLERAELLESTPGGQAEAREIYASLAASEAPAAVDAAERLDALLENAGDWEGLRERLEARLDQEPDPIAAHERLAGICRDRLGDRPGAIRHLQVAAREEPERPELWQALARLFEEEGRAKDQLDALEAELRTDPDDERRRLLHARAAVLCRDALEDEEAALRHFERVHDLDPNDPTAASYLMERLESGGRHAELVAVLERRLAGDVEGESETALRLRIASLRAGPLDDVEGAIAMLEGAAREPATLAVAAEPLADLYLRSDRRDDFMALCRSAIGACQDPGERASWSLRLADAQREAGEDAAAAESYRQALADRPDAREARSALRDLYRRLGESDALARLLEAELARVGGQDEIPLRLELGELLEQALSRPGDALVHLRRVLEIEPGHAAAEERCLALTEQLGRHEERLLLLDGALERERLPAARARLLARRGALLAGPLERAEEAATSLAESLELDPSQPAVRRQLRATLEGLGRWQGVIDCLAQEARALEPAARGPVFDEAARIAAEHLTPDDALPWLERLRAVRPEDAETLARIADVHRRADRPEELVRALEAELALDPEPERRRDLHLERADLFEKRLGRPTWAAQALEDAREADPAAPRVLERLSSLYAKADRPEDLARVVEARLDHEEGRERRRLHQELARLYAGPLGEPERATDHLWRALCDAPESGGERIELLRALGQAFRRGDREDLWARAAEAEIAALDPSEPVFAERRCELSRELAVAYDGPLVRPGSALPRWRALVDEAGPDALGEAGFDQAERALLAGLRAAGEDVELARRLEQRLERRPDADRWLELARLRAERLHRPGGAAAAYREVLRIDPDSREALLGLRGVAERLGDWAEVARTLEIELERPLERPAPARGALWRRLGEIAWRRLDSTTRASRAFAAALESDPNDLVALRSLQVLFETMEDWRGAGDLYRSEVEVLADAEPERRRSIWLRLATLSRERLADPEAAADAYAEASELGALGIDEQAEWADLYRRLDRPERFAEVFERWCDADASPAGADDHLELAGVLEALGRDAEARTRLERAVRADPEHARAWDELVRLREAAGDRAGCLEALERSASCQAGDAAAERRHRAARLAENDDPERALDLLERAVTDDPARREAHADLARIAGARERHGRALVAAQRMLDLAPLAPAASGDDAGPASLELEAALAGARAAGELGRHDAAEPLFAAAREADPRHPGAVAGHAEILFARSEHEAAREALETLLQLDGEDPDHARHLAQLAHCLDAAGACDAALARFEEAIEREPELELAQEGRIAVLERGGRIAEAVAALRSWSECAATPVERSARLLRAAEHELAREDGAAAAEDLLREASADPENDRVWALLARLLADAGRGSEALDVASRALDSLPETAPSRAALQRVRAEVLEQDGERAEAAEAWRQASRLDPSAPDAALAAARLLRGLGEWREAADALREFVNEHDDAEPSGLATALHQLGRLLAGPLENVEGAIEVYRRAVAADPELGAAREALADLLAHRPEHHDEALERHRDLLGDEPTRVASLRGVLRIAAARSDDRALTLGRTILTALGLATSEEREGALEAVVLPDREPRFGDPLWESARRLVQESAAELGEALGVGAPGADRGAGARDPLASFRDAVVTAEGRLSAPAIVPLPTDELAEVVGLLADLALEAEGVRGKGRLVNDLTRQLGRRARKRLRRLLEGRGNGEVGRIDFAAWRDELRGLAGVSALSATGVPLRTALCAWLPAGEEDEAPGPEGDITALVAGSAEARALLRRLGHDWVDGLARRKA